MEQRNDYTTVVHGAMICIMIFLGHCSASLATFIRI